MKMSLLTLTLLSSMMLLLQRMKVRLLIKIHCFDHHLQIIFPSPGIFSIQDHHRYKLEGWVLPAYMDCTMHSSKAILWRSYVCVCLNVYSIFLAGWLKLQMVGEGASPCCEKEIWKFTTGRLSSQNLNFVQLIRPWPNEIVPLRDNDLTKLSADILQLL